MSMLIMKRGWLRRINNPGSLAADQAFGLQLNYANRENSYNGNIGSLRWQTMVPAGLSLNGEVQSYEYTYDKLDRLILANYITPNKTGRYNEALSYDVMGNIISLQRTGGAGSTNINNFSYSYSNSNQSNQLYQVTDAANNNQVTTYTYDLNGNQISDSRKDISIEYNLHNLPYEITNFSNNDKLKYIYTITGAKLRKTLNNANPRDYVGGIEYNNNVIEFIETEEGRAVPSGGGCSYEYSLKDHLGNTRAVVKEDGSIVQVQDYYAFGMEMNPGNAVASSPANQYKYNGKEMQTELGLKQYDYSARFYDPVIGRFTTIDPLAEKFSSWTFYNYGFNNPIRFIDPDGREGTDWIKRDGKIKWDEKVTSAKDKDLKAGDQYIGKELKTKTASYNNDGSVFFKNETEAYNYMWDNSNSGSKLQNMIENAAWLTKDGVAVLPTSGTKYNGESFKNGLVALHLKYIA